MNFVTVGGRRSGRAAPSLRDTPQRQLTSKTGLHLSQAKRCSDEAGYLNTHEQAENRCVIDREASRIATRILHSGERITEVADILVESDGKFVQSGHRAKAALDVGGLILGCDLCKLFYALS